VALLRRRAQILAKCQVRRCTELPRRRISKTYFKYDVRKAKFSLPEAVALLACLDLDRSDRGCKPQRPGNEAMPPVATQIRTPRWQTM